MSAESAGDSAVKPNNADAPAAPARRSPIPMLIPLAAVGLFWGAWLAFGMLDLGTFVQFLARTGGLLLLTVVLSVWWFFLVRMPIMWRLGLPAFGVACSVVAVLLRDSSVFPLYLFLWALPAIYTFGAIWLAAASGATKGVRFGGLAAVIALCWVPGDLIRMEGVTGFGRPDAYWRWSTSAEEQFLADLPQSTGEEPQADEVIAVSDGDWYQFRGPGGDSSVPGVEIETDWEAHPPKLIWEHAVGPGWSSILVIGDRLYTQEQRGEVEAAVCYDAATGKQIWTYEHEGRFEEELGGVGPRATPAFGDGKVYFMSAMGRLDCLDAGDGSLVWSRDLLKDFNSTVPVWAFSVSPLFHEGVVYTFIGGADEQAFVALDAAAGDTKWSAKSGTESYSSPTLLTIDGVPQIVFLSKEKIASFDPASGDELWSFAATTQLSRPTMQPQLVGDHTIVLAFSPAGIEKIEVAKAGDAWSSELVWDTQGIKPDFSDYLIHDGYIYGFDVNIFCCVDLETGDRQWKKGRYGAGQAMLLPDQSLILAMTEEGELKLVECNPKKLVELGSIQALEGKTWNHLAYSRGRLYVRNSEQIACWELPIKGAKSAPADEADTSADGESADAGDSVDAGDEPVDANE